MVHFHFLHCCSEIADHILRLIIVQVQESHMKFGESFLSILNISVAKCRKFTLTTKNFGRFKFRTKFCPALRTPEIFCVRNLKASEIYKYLIIHLKYFQDLFHCSWMEIFLFAPNFLLVTLLGVQLPMILVEISFERDTKKLRFFNCCRQF